MTQSLSDLLPPVDAAQATRHLEVLHAGASGFLSLVLLGARRRERHCFVPAESLVPAADPAASLAELQDVVDARWNVYTACSAFRAVPERGRGTRQDLGSVPGVWADLDVKPGTEGYFQDEAGLAAFAARLPPPTLSVASGSGGRHLYWLAKERLEPDEGERLLRAWLDFLRAEAGEYVIEYVHDGPRILRLAGTVRWPKEGDAQADRPMRVALLEDRGPRWDAAELALLASSAHDEACAMRDERRARRDKKDLERRANLDNRGLDLHVYDHAVRRFNVMEDWARLLGPTGWTLFSDQRDGAARCRYWTRPGKPTSMGKSASTDWVNDDGTPSTVMTIYSLDDELAHLRENLDTSDAHGLCTKYHFAKVMLYDDNEEALLRAIAAGNGRLP